MGEILNIYQYQSVDFTSTSSGALPLTLLWSFPGGSPISGTGSTENVIYNVPGTYNVTLTATDTYGTTNSLVETNIIQVDPSTLVPGISGPSPSSVLMGQSYSLYDQSVGNPYPATSWLWTLPAGQTAGTQNVTVAGYSDWYTLTGSYSGSPGSSFTGNITLASSNGFNTSSATATVEVQKLGLSESLFINTTGGAPTASTVVTGFSASLPISVLPGPAEPIKTTEFGYTGSYYIAKMDFSSRGSTNKTNLYFHSTNESASSIITSGLWDASTFLDVVGGFLVIDPSIYTNYSGITPGPGIINGNYVTSGQVSEFFVADETGLLQDLYENRNYQVQLTNYLLSSPYKNLHSGNLQYLNNYYSTNPTPGPGAFTQMTFVDTTNSGASGSNPVVYSSNYLTSLGPAVPPNPVYEVYVTISVPPSTTYGATATFGSPGSTGNYGDFFVAQNTPNGVGIASILNSAINSAVAGGTGFVEFIAESSANCDYSSPTGPGYDPTNYYGLIAVFRNSLNLPLYTVSISDNSNTINSSYTPSLTYPIAPFSADFSNAQGSYQTCSGLYPTNTPITITLPLTPPFSVMSFGGTIGYP